MGLQQGFDFLDPRIHRLHLQLQLRHLAGDIRLGRLRGGGQCKRKKNSWQTLQGLLVGVNDVDTAVLGKIRICLACRAGLLLTKTDGFQLLFLDAQHGQCL